MSLNSSAITPGIMSGLSRDTLECILASSVDLTRATIANATAPVVDCSIVSRHGDPIQIEVVCKCGFAEFKYWICGDANGTYTLDEICELLCDFRFHAPYELHLTFNGPSMAIAFMKFAKGLPDHENLRWYDPFA